MHGQPHIRSSIQIWTRHMSYTYMYMFLVFYLLLFSCGPAAQRGPGPPHSRGFWITLRHPTLSRDSSVRVISLSQRPLPDNTQHSQQTDIHTPDWIRIRSPSKPVAAHGHWDRPFEGDIHEN